MSSISIVGDPNKALFSTPRICIKMDNNCLPLKALKIGMKEWYSKPLVIEKTRVFAATENSSACQRYVFQDSED
ncbi:hypothetical protein RJ641_008350 [Dillenia turbinata]|uniref:Uncharacterized protein n=1 Tax=Dillenia turbinata TaxID=194707 RepID=A0AAN8VAR2_9MAGN